MKIQSTLSFLALATAVALCGLLDSSFSWAQKPPPPANPQAPTIYPIMPSGVQRGQTNEISLAGTNLAGPTGVSLGCLSKITISTEDKNGQDPAKCKVRVDVPADVPVGWYPFRFATSKGVSNLRVICVDDVPQFVSAGANRTKAMAQLIAVPGAVTGAVNTEQGDFYKFTVKPGQRLSFDCQARRLGSAIDAFMYVYDAKTGRELAYDNDSPGCQTDPRISYTFKQAGEYLVEIKDVLNRGGAEFFYRLRIGDFPLATTAVPMAAKRGTKAKIGFAGPAVDPAALVDVDVPGDPALSFIWVAPKGPSGLHGWPVPVALSEHDETVEKEPNNDIKSANRLAVPGGVTGRFQQSADFDFHVFSAKKGQKLTIEANTLELYSPTLVLMILRNAKTGAEIARTNPAAAPPADQKIDFTAAEDSDYALDVQHLILTGGHSETYRVSIRSPASSFDVNLPNERFDIAPSGIAAVPFQIVRRGYTGPIELSVRGSESLSGTATVKAGQNAGLLMVTAKGDVPMGAYQFQVIGKATLDGQVVVQAASARAMVIQSLNGTLFPPMHLQTFVSLAVKEKAPFSLAIKMDPPEGIPGGKANVTVSVTREAGFAEEITLNPPVGLPATIPAPKVGAIAKDKTEVSFPLDLNAKTPLGEYFVFVTAKSKHEGKEYSAAAPPLVLVLGQPFDLQVEPALLSLKAGDKAKLKITAVRRGGYKGPIALDVRKLPAMVTAGKAMIAADQSSTEVEITVGPTAAPGDTSADVAGTATAMNNLQNASPLFTVRVQKK